MAAGKKIILKDHPDQLGKGGRYEVTQLHNMLEFSIGQMIDAKEVRSLISRKVTVIIKGK